MASDFDLLVLGAISILGAGADGTAIRRAVEQVSQGVVLYGDVYDALKRLREQGLISSRREDRLFWTITDAGRYALVGDL